ncbi:O-antigen ligase [Leptotrichia sp. oral taxon 879]|uniref:O-antigen ligase family protein n=1 Tax=Leptotrichia sp. oral taxon 879 TaxID=1227267 RepID=UPI0003AE0270|nr:O-antigen ligase family protein [Leptotrichia sp. oral taxon 879]ERK52046.1 O-antigen polymerase [Leptotrichia sp. oral taxon 879 str. F0557]
MNKKINLIINRIGFIFCILVGMALFLSEKFENNVAIRVLSLIFIIAMISRENRKTLFKSLDIEFSIELLLFIFVPFIIAYFDGGIDTRLDNYILRYLIFFPFIFFVKDMKKVMILLKATLFSAVIVMILATFNFIKDYKEWANPVGMYYPRITAILTVQDFANIMCIILLFLMSFLFFYKNENNKKNKIIKIFLFIMTTLTFFLVIVNRSKMVYICLLPTVFYIIFKKKKKYVLAAILICLGGYFVLPNSITDRLQYIVNYEKDPSSNLRVIFWKTGLEAFRQKPILGWQWEDRKEFNLEYYKKTGVSNYVHQNFLDKLSEWPIYYVHTHSTYLQFLLDFGIVGILFFVIFFVSTFMKAASINFSKNKENIDSRLVALEIGTKAALAAWAIQGITDINLNNKYMIITSVILLFLLNYLWREKIKLEKG